MDRNEFIDLLAEELSEDPDNNRLNRILEAADEYAENEKEQLSCEGTTEGTTSDLISRRAAIDAINSWRGRFSEEYNEAIDDCENSIKELQTAQPERKKGEWLPDNNNAYEMRFVCSCCKESEVVPTIGFTKYKPLWDFCQNCGADMRGEKDG